MEKAVVMALLRGGFCANCRYLIQHGKKLIGGSWDYVDLDPPHCALKTDIQGLPTKKSEVRNAIGYSCKSFWKKKYPDW
jgi:hypothetical protein